MLTMAMYNARELAMSRMRAEAMRLNADGIVGVQLLIQDYEWGADVMEFMAAGTVVRATAAQGGQLRAPDGGPEAAQEADGIVRQSGPHAADLRMCADPFGCFDDRIAQAQRRGPVVAGDPAYRLKQVVPRSRGKNRGWHQLPDAMIASISCATSSAA